jgi:hypothetical protein
MADVKLILQADNSDLIKKAKEVQEALKELQKQQKILFDANKKGFSNTKELEDYTKKMDDLKKKTSETQSELDKLNKKEETLSNTTSSLTADFAKWITSLGIVTTVVNALVAAFTKTQQGIVLVAQGMAAFNQVLYNVVNGLGQWNANVTEAIILAKKMNDLRIKDRFELLEAKKLMREYNELYTEGIDATITHDKKIKLLTEAKKKYQESIDIEIASTREQLVLAKKAFDLQPTNDKAQLAVVELMGKMDDLRGQRELGVRRLTRQITGEIERQAQAEIDALNKIKELGDKLDEAFGKDADLADEKRKKAAEDRADYIRSQGATAEQENQKFINDYLAADKREKDTLWENEVKFQRDIAKAQRDGDKAKWDKMLEDEKKRKEFDDYIFEQRKENIENLGGLVVEYMSIIEELSTKELEKAQRDREVLDTRINEAQNDLDAEIELYKAGYASNVEAKQKEIEALKLARDKALKDEEEARRKTHRLNVAALVAQKAVDVASIISQTGVANAKAIAISPLTFGQPWVALNTVRSALSIAAAVAAVAAASAAKFAKGGWTGDGKYRDETGERVSGMVHEREFVVRKGPAYKFREVLEAINRDDKKMIFNSFNKLNPTLVGGTTNVIVENEGPNKRLDKISAQLEKQNKKQSREDRFEIDGATIIKRGNNIQIIKR